MPAERAPGVRLGAVRDGDALQLHVSWRAGASACSSIPRGTAASLNLAKNYVRLNEFPEWFVVDENWLYRIRGGAGPVRLRLGSELIQGERFAAGDWRIEPLGPPPYGTQPIAAR